MDKNAIKKYAVWARRELISRVSQKAMQYGITDTDIIIATAPSVNGVVLSAEEMSQRKALIVQIEAKGYEQVMEEVAYTWFNRFIALRFMEVNGYLPSRVRVFTDESNAFKPQILSEAIDLELDGLDMEKVYALKETNDNDALFKYLIITQCNALSPILPRMFQRIADYTELLFPDNLLREGSVIEQMIAMIPEDDWKDAVQIIGWLYQYYNSEKKDEVFAALKNNVKISKDTVPAATQMFTPDWIVRYMVENSLGRLWVEGHPSTPAQSNWEYFLPETEQEHSVQEQLAVMRKEYADMDPAQLKCVDPCAGSGHILVYMFDLLMQIYEDYGYSAREAVNSIIINNLYGLDIDNRAAQLAYFAVMMKARQYDRRFFTRKNEAGQLVVPQPHVYVVCESNDLDGYAVEYFIDKDEKLQNIMDVLIRELYDASEYGSILNITPQDFSALYARFDDIRQEVGISKEVVLSQIFPLVQVAETLAQKYDIVITNPPYMSSSGMGPKLSNFVKKHYADSKSDMSTVFMEKALSMCKPNGFMAMINIPVWMFLTSYTKLRSKLLVSDTLDSMLHLGRGVFGADFGTTAFVIRKNRIPSYKASYRRLFDKPSSVDNEDTKKHFFFSRKGRFFAQQENFLDIADTPIVYWLNDTMLSLLASENTVGKSYDVGSGLSTADNERFLRFHWEVELPKVAESQQENKKWFHFQKGGEFRRWYGNLEYVVNWENDGADIKYWVTHNPKDPGTTSWSRRIFNVPLYFQHGITWAVIGIGKISFRETGVNSMISNAAGGIFSFKSDREFYNLLGGLNTKLWGEIFQIISPTVNYSAGIIQKAPLPSVECSDIVKSCISISKDDWNSFETSWDFLAHPLVLFAFVPDWNGGHRAPLSECYERWEALCSERFKQLKDNEEELNRIFIEAYNLEDVFTPEVEDKDVTVRLADKKRDIKSLISYAVGCMFGRYSLDAPGLVYAGGEWDDSQYTTFRADKDSIIPICDDEYFADDIVGRFIRFIEVVYGKDSLQENLRFIADALGGSGQPKDVIRKYFMDEFYSDHLKTYQKRPIYWLFDSGKRGGFRALVYMHRYQPDTIARMRTDYVHEQQSRYRTAIADLEQRISSASTSERVKLSKRLKTLQEQAAEIQSYEEKIHHLADQYIAIDLDDGVKKNYEIFKDVLAKIK